MVRYYKVIHDDRLIGVGTDAEFRCVQPKHGILVKCQPEQAEFMQLDNQLYKAP